MTKYPRGAEWRKWDLHLHTPGTAKNDQFSSDNDVWEDYLQRIEQDSNIAVLGITDYFSIENYIKLKKYQENGRISQKTIIPNVELRILPVTNSETPINLHVIFDPDISSDIIEREFFRKLKFSYQNAEYSCIRADLIALGRAYTSNQTLEENVAWREGVCQFNVPFSDLKKVFSGNVIEKRCLIGVSNSSNDGNSGIQHSSLAAVRQEIYRLSNFIFSGNPNDREYFLGKGVDNKKKVISKYGSIKPCFTGSDAHSLEKIGVFSLNRYTWLKADPTFDGLKQVINEPEERVFIGEAPKILEKVATNRTKYISELSVRKVADYSGSLGTWFGNINIPINHELVGIIGNKGSGKSAIADIISLCSNHYDEKDFSFLTPKKFREKSGKIAKNFCAELVWESGIAYKKNLNDKPDEAAQPLVKYIPQGMFERLTNEISTAKDFQAEIESVVFSHIPEDERLGSRTFKELISKKSSSAETEIEFLEHEVSKYNEKIIELEKKTTPIYKKEIEHKISKKEEEFKALVAPKIISDPNKDPEKQKQSESVNQKIDSIKKEIEKIETNILTARKKKETALNNIQTLTTVMSEVNQKQVEIEKFKDIKKTELEAFDINIDKLISLRIDLSKVKLLIQSEESKLKEVRVLLGEYHEKEGGKSLVEQLEEKKNSLKLQTSKLDSEQKLFQDYLTAKNKWEKERAKIIGTKEQLDTLEYYKFELNYIKNILEQNLESIYETRRNLTKSIFEKKQSVIAVYKGAKVRLNNIIEENTGTFQGYKIEVDACLVKKTDFYEQFFRYINQNKMGTFYSKDGGEAQLKSMGTEINFDKKDDVISFLDSIIFALKNDKRDLLSNPRTISDQVNNLQGFYDYLYSLSFLDNNYQLKQGDKNLDQLSPGERGALLLVFYLLLDKSDIPLIIDQPEDNLDNHSVATVLVPFIRKAKKKRQIIIVTHNPNLAVVADAEQIIYVNLDKERNYIFSTVSGSIENKKVNNKIVDVLEGAMPAFNMRKKKYYE